VEAGICIRNAQKKATPLLLQHTATASWQIAKNHTLLNYWGCSHGKEEIHCRRSHRQSKTTTGKVLSSMYTTPGLSFAAAL
jgi:hypothetical protein